VLAQRASGDIAFLPGGAPRSGVGLCGDGFDFGFGDGLSGASGIRAFGRLGWCGSFARRMAGGQRGQDDNEQRGADGRGAGEAFHRAFSGRVARENGWTRETGLNPRRGERTPRRARPIICSTGYRASLSPDDRICREDSRAVVGECCALQAAKAFYTKSKATTKRWMAGTTGVWLSGLRVAGAVKSRCRGSPASRCSVMSSIA
jgi:hypothetical protein